MQYAYATLNRAGLGLWLYFNKNQDDYQFELSQKACAEWGIKKDSYYSGVNELIRYGFLVPISEGSNIYTFYETPLSEKANSHYPKSFSVSPQSMSKMQNDFSEKQERNITNITSKEQDITINDFYKTKDKKFKDTFYYQDGEEHFVVATDVEISDQFFAWVCGFGKKAKIIGHEDVVEEFKEYLDKIREMY